MLSCCRHAMGAAPSLLGCTASKAQECTPGRFSTPERQFGACCGITGHLHLTLLSLCLPGRRIVGRRLWLAATECGVICFSHCRHAACRGAVLSAGRSGWQTQCVGPFPHTAVTLPAGAPCRAQAAVAGRHRLRGHPRQRSGQ